MQNEYIDVIFNETELLKDMNDKVFDRCEFNHCDLSELSYSYSDFEDCTFTSCNLSMANVANSRFKNIKFIECKLFGVNFLDVDKFLLKLHFSKCIINSCIFSGLPLNQCSFLECNIDNSDFINTQLKNVSFNKSKFSDVTFHESNLTGADFREAIGYSINLNNNNISKAKFSNPEALNLLKSLNIVIE